MVMVARGEEKMVGKEKTSDSDGKRKAVEGNEPQWESGPSKVANSRN